MLEDGRIQNGIDILLLLLFIVPHPSKKMKTLNTIGIDSRRWREEVVESSFMESGGITPLLCIMNKSFLSPPSCSNVGMMES
jgi:hypothetical protein